MELRMPYINVVMIAGRLVDDPHPLTGKDDTPGCAVTVAVNRWSKGKTVATTYVDAIAWGDTAKAMTENLGKGSPVFIVGSLGQYAKKTGKVEVKRLQVSIQSCQFLASRPKEETAT